MGEGRNAIYLAQNGFQVEGVDISAGAVEKALGAARAAGVTIEARVADLEGGYEIKREAYDVIICFNYLQRSLIPQIKGGLKKGGVVVYETFTLAQRQFGRPRNPDFLLEPGELRRMFEDFECLRYREGVVEGPKAIASIVARKRGVRLMGLDAWGGVAYHGHTDHFPSKEA
jgi:SAM-dependent methyltransferase